MGTGVAIVRHALGVALGHCRSKQAELREHQRREREPHKVQSSKGR